MDETAGRRVAAENGVQVRGTLALLEEAAQRGLLELREALSRLQSTGIFLAKDVVAQALARDQARRQQSR
jgi:predicted nucleic acid-binding protein